MIPLPKFKKKDTVTFKTDTTGYFEEYGLLAFNTM
jgi:hypothetical protein